MHQARSLVAAAVARRSQAAVATSVYDLFQFSNLTAAAHLEAVACIVLLPDASHIARLFK